MNEIERHLNKFIGKTCGLNTTWFIDPCKGKIEVVDYLENLAHYPLHCTKCGHRFYTPGWLELMGGWSVITSQVKIYEENCKMLEEIK